jgi:hypothetical protein
MSIEARKWLSVQCSSPLRKSTGETAADCRDSIGADVAGLMSRG